MPQLNMIEWILAVSTLLGGVAAACGAHRWVSRSWRAWRADPSNREQHYHGIQLSFQVRYGAQPASCQAVPRDRRIAWWGVVVLILVAIGVFGGFMAIGAYRAADTGGSEVPGEAPDKEQQ